MHASFNSLISDFSPDNKFSTGRNDVVEEVVYSYTRWRRLLSRISESDKPCIFYILHVCQKRKNSVSEIDFPIAPIHEDCYDSSTAILLRKKRI